MSIPTGEDWRIRKALGYMSPHKVLQWAQVTISPGINAKDVSRIHRDMTKSARPIGTGAQTDDRPIHRHSELIDNGDLAKKINAHVIARSKECGVHPDFYRRSLGWR